MEAGDRVKNIYTGDTGTIIYIGDWDDDFNPYKVIVALDQRVGHNDPGGRAVENVGNFKESHLKIVKEDSVEEQTGLLWQ